MNRNSILVASAVLYVGCYEAPNPDGFLGTDIGDIEVIEGLDAIADGQTHVDMVLNINPRTANSIPITIETSSGLISTSADSTGATARKISVSNVGTGRIPFVLRVGNEPGTTFITATVGGYPIYEELDLGISPPKSIVLSAPKTTITADGESKLSITASLLATDSGQKVSKGARIRYAICCQSTDGLPEPCTGPDPMIIPEQAQLGEGQAIIVDAVTERITSEATTIEPIPVFVIAHAVVSKLDATVALCDSPMPAAIRSALSLGVRPIAK